MKRITLAAVLVTLAVAASACSGGSEGAEEPAANDADTLTRRQKDSIVSTMPIPGAGAVGAALRSADSLRARQERHDSIAGVSRRQ